MKKKILSTLLALTLSGSLFAQTALAVKMYAPDGRTAIVAEVDVAAWKAVGWYTENSITMYAPDGRTAKVLLADIKAWKAVGWYDVPVTKMYAPSGKTAVVAKSDVDAWKKVGWYDSPYTPTYTKPSSSSHYSNTVYIGETGDKYHKKSCSTLKGNGRAISLQEALAQGRAACKRCGG